ncbi:DNA-binding CsgD family transcriptional regulator [Thiogranum longum]|uniref:DNA-binding CsgD family transcriptional regulator n=2 Tax=Thiogranum longum TaxID=1537524 RepID=A0A4V2PGU0_9GAMM|nr:DNA-binding CsgD family transcriptional regulator [Thiogranum longum]
MSEARDFGINSGVSFPLHTAQGDFAMLSFASESLQALPEPRLQKECMLWVTEGKTAWETSQILSISERTVTFHLQNVQHKLGVNNRQQAVARAVALGIIEPQFG